MLSTISIPRFANCRLQLPCIAFRLTEVRRMPNQDRETYLTYAVKADRLHDLLITTEDKLIPFSRAIATGQTFFLVRPWDRHLLDLPDFAGNTQGMVHVSAHESPVENALVDSDSRTLRLIDRLRQPFHGFSGKRGPITSESHLPALRLIARLRQPFRAILLAQQRGGEYTRIASDHDIIAQLKDRTSVCNMMDCVRTVEILFPD
ncbi:hypothetical protein BDR03DRAFT_954365 [Suillus americanus]|nr:hypothetical protein BDR03DRAFT_954365 [Suillus americanus]